MNKQVKVLVDWAATIGWTNQGQTGGGHYLLLHTNGSRYTISATPSEYRGDQNQRADLRRLAGVANDSPNAGRYRKGPSKRAWNPPPGPLEEYKAYLVLLDQIEQKKVAARKNPTAEANAEIVALVERAERCASRLNHIAKTNTPSK